MTEESNHQTFTQEKFQQEYRDHKKIKSAQKLQPIPSNLDWRYRNLIFWIPVFVGIVLVAIAVTKEYSVLEQKYYCYKSRFIPNKYNETLQQATTREVLINTRYSFQIYVDSYDDNVASQIAQFGSFEPNFTNLIGHIVSFRDNILFVGSHYGLEAISAGKVIGQFGRMFVLQPSSFLFQILNKNLEINGLKSYTKAYQIASSDSKLNGTIQVISPDKKQNSTSTTTIQQVQFDKIDDILPQDVKLNFAFISSKNQLIKTLIGMKQVIKRSPKLVILMKQQTQQNSIVSDSEYKKLRNFLSNYGYKAYNYEGGQFKRECSIGSFTWKGNIQNLELEGNQYIIMFPENYSLPK